MKNKKGFTLVELIAIIIVIGLIIGILTPTAIRLIANSKKNAFREGMRSIVRSAEMYMEENNLKSLPEEGLFLNDEKLGLDYDDGYEGVIKYIDGEIVLENIHNGTYCGNGSSEDFTISKYEEGECDVVKPVIDCFIMGTTETEGDTITGYKYYDKNCDSKNIVIPAEVDGVPVKYIADGAFVEEEYKEYSFYMDFLGPILTSSLNRQYASLAKNVDSKYLPSKLKNSPSYMRWFVPGLPIIFTIDIPENVEKIKNRILTDFNNLVLPEEVTSELTKEELSFIFELALSSKIPVKEMYDFKYCFDKNNGDPFEESIDYLLTDYDNYQMCILPFSEIDMSPDVVNEPNDLKPGSLIKPVEYKTKKTENPIINSTSQLLGIFESIIAGGGIQTVDFSQATNLEEIGDYAFINNEISSIKFGNSSKIKKIGTSAFALNYISSVDLRKLTNLTDLGSFAFFHNNLEYVALNNSIDTLEEGVFAFNMIYSLDLGTNIKRLTTLNFAMHDLYRVKIPSSMEFMGLLSFLSMNCNYVDVDVMGDYERFTEGDFDIAGFDMGCLN